MLNPDNIRGPGDAMFAVVTCMFLLLAASYPIIRTIGWWMEGAVEPVLAIVSLGLYLGLIVVAMTTPQPVALAALFAIFASAVVTPILGRAKDQADLRSIEDERFQQYAAALERNPMDPVARIAYAEALYRRGEVDQAIEHLAWTLQQYPRLSFRIRPQLDDWMRQRDEARSDEALCPACGRQNPAELIWCSYCGASLARASGFRHGEGRKSLHTGGVLVRGWIVCATILLAFVAVYWWMPGSLAGPAGFGLVLAGVWWFYRWTGLQLQQGR
ncbi:MAG: hypothetical protein ACP5VE_06890 [Chthonomonadales bacterium]